MSIPRRFNHKSAIARKEARWAGALTSRLLVCKVRRLRACIWAGARLTDRKKDFGQEPIQPTRAKGSECCPRGSGVGFVGGRANTRLRR
jgi:hypothetical protein